MAVEDAAFFFFVLPALFMLALAIGALLLLPLIIGRAATGRAPKPPWPLIAVALALGTLVVFPVKADVRACPSAVPLPLALADDADPLVDYLSACDEDSVQIVEQR